MRKLTLLSTTVALAVAGTMVVSGAVLAQSNNDSSASTNGAANAASASANGTNSTARQSLQNGPVNQTGSNSSITDRQRADGSTNRDAASTAGTAGANVSGQAAKNQGSPSTGNPGNMPDQQQPGYGNRDASGTAGANGSGSGMSGNTSRNDMGGMSSSESGSPSPRTDRN